jgi:hypothetical protein
MATGHLLDLVREHRDEVPAAAERHRGLSSTVFGSHPAVRTPMPAMSTS